MSQGSEWQAPETSASAWKRHLRSGFFWKHGFHILPPLNLSDLWWGVPGGQEKSSLNAEKKQGGNEWSKVQINKLNQAKNTTIFVGPNKNIHGCCCGDFFFYNSHPVFPVPLWTCDMSSMIELLYSIDGSMQWFFYGHSYLAPHQSMTSVSSEASQHSYCRVFFWWQPYIWLQTIKAL